MAMQRVLD